MQNVLFQIGPKKFFLLKTLKILCHGHILYKMEGIIGTFYEKELQKPNQKELRIEEVIKRKCNKLYEKWKVMIIL